jgi:xylulokinase
MPLVLGVDSSTQATKVEVRDADTGELVAEGRAPHPPTTPPRSEQHPQAWSDALAAARAGLPRIDAIAVAGQQHGLVVLDAAGVPVRPAKLWNDTESAPDAQWLRSKITDDAWARACGSVPVAAFTVTKLSWLHRSEPDAWTRLARVCLPHDWLTLQLTGAFVTDRGDASGTGYFSPATNAYQYDLLAIVDDGRDWKSALPNVLGPTEAAGTLDGAVVAPGTGDNMAAALGIALAPGDVAMSLGTSGTVFAVSSTPTSDATGAVAGFADATGRFLPLVCTLNATKVTDTIARVLGVQYEQLDALALDAPPGAGGLTLVPYFDGERTPDRPDATGTIAGLRTASTREHVARAAFEGVVCGLLDGLDALRANGVDTGGRLVLVGGGARSDAYQRIVADLAGRPVTIPPPHEHVAAGACAQAAAILHGSAPDEIARAWHLDGGTCIEPDESVDRAEIRARYRAAAAG